MSVGFTVSKMEVDNRSGTLARTMIGWAEDTIKFQDEYLAGATEAQLEGLGYTPDDVALLKSAVGDMYKLAKVCQGLDIQATAYDFRTFAARLAGIVV